MGLSHSGFRVSSADTWENLDSTARQMLPSELLTMIRDLCDLHESVHGSAPVLVPSLKVKARFDFALQVRIQPSATLFWRVKVRLQERESLNLPTLCALNPAHDCLNAFLKGFSMYLVELFTGMDNARPSAFSAEYVCHVNSLILRRLSESFFCEGSTKRRKVETASS